MTVLVGIDGSEESQRALEWAADEARLRDDELVVVHVYHIPAAYLATISPTAITPEELAQGRARRQRDCCASR